MFLGTIWGGFFNSLAGTFPILVYDNCNVWRSSELLDFTCQPIIAYCMSHDLINYWKWLPYKLPCALLCAWQFHWRPFWIINPGTKGYEQISQWPVNIDCIFILYTTRRPILYIYEISEIS